MAKKQSEIHIAAYGKVNLSLNITGVRGGMHTLDSVVACIDLCDTVRARFDLSGKVRVCFEGCREDIPENNSVTKAIGFLQKTQPMLGADIKIVKRIPLAAGLGGSSADAAAVVRAAAKIMPDLFGNDDTVRGSVEIGSDVPVLVKGGCALMRGIGDEIRCINSGALHLCLACGLGGVSSGEAYKLFDKLYPEKRYCPTDTEALVSALESGDVGGIAKQLHNALTGPAVSLCGSVAPTLAAVKSTGALAAVMTGSGNCCFGLYESEKAARIAEKELTAQGLWAEYARTFIE